MFFHYITIPTGRFWKKLMKSGVIFPIQHKEPISILGKTPGTDDWAHKSDIIRLDALKKYGGIYIDTDVLVLRSFDHFRQFPFTMGNWRTPDLDLILCNAVIVSTKDSDFLAKWYEMYRDANFECWDCESVVKPTEMARKSVTNPAIHVANRTVFYAVDWLARSTPILMGSGQESKPSVGTTYEAPFDGIYGQHLWNARHKRKLSAVDGKFVCLSRSLYGRMLRYALRDTPWLAVHCMVEPNGKLATRGNWSHPDTPH